jgi:hypothetical protein
MGANFYLTLRIRTFRPSAGKRFQILWLPVDLMLVRF